MTGKPSAGVGAGGIALPGAARPDQTVATALMRMTSILMRIEMGVCLLVDPEAAAKVREGQNPASVIKPSAVHWANFFASGSEPLVRIAEAMEADAAQMADAIRSVTETGDTMLHDDETTEPATETTETTTETEGGTTTHTEVETPVETPAAPSEGDGETAEQSQDA